MGGGLGAIVGETPKLIESTKSGKYNFTIAENGLNIIVNFIKFTMLYIDDRNSYMIHLYQLMLLLLFQYKILCSVSSKYKYL